MGVQQKPSCQGVMIPGKQGRIFSTIFLPDQTEAPVIVQCHGVPGNDKLMDFGLELRERGFATIIFHAAGSWGSDGNYSVDGYYQDTDSVIEYIKANENGWFDPSRILVLGHSMGGLVATRTIGAHPDVAGGVIIMPANLYQAAEDVVNHTNLSGQKEMFDQEFGPWLTGYSFEGLFPGAKENTKQYDLLTYAEGISEKPTLAVVGDQDEILDKTQNILPLVEAVSQYGVGKISEAHFDVDHGMSWNRAAIRKAVGDFLCQHFM